MLYPRAALISARPTFCLNKAYRPVQVRYYTTHENLDSTWPYPIFASERIRDRKSVFLAHASKLPSRDLLPTFLDNLTGSSKLKRATHCMYAYRISGVSEVHGQTTAQVITGQHDGGESGSGNHLSHLLEVMGCENVVVVVSRWYGGIHLGSDRWRRISDVAKEALDKGGFREKKSTTTPKKKRRRK